MCAAQKLSLISVEDYLAAELRSETKHEYLGGVVHAMGEFTNRHNIIAMNVLANLHGKLRGKRFRPINSSAKIRVRLPTHVRFYYPDASVVCPPISPQEYFQDAPVVIVEVLSPWSRRADFGEKKHAYLTIPTLSVYLLVEQDESAVVAYRRTNDGFVREVYESLDAIIALPEIETELALSDVYEDVTFTPEPDENDMS